MFEVFELTPTIAAIVVPAFLEKRKVAFERINAFVAKYLLSDWMGKTRLMSLGQKAFITYFTSVVLMHLTSLSACQYYWNFC